MLRSGDPFIPRLASKIAAAGKEGSKEVGMTNKEHYPSIVWPGSATSYAHAFGDILA